MNVKPPSQETIQAYHSALKSMAGISERAVNSKNVHREAGETSTRNMMSNAAGIIDSRCFIQARAELIPLAMMFNAEVASAGAITAR